jgi:collagen type VII alpha
MSGFLGSFTSGGGVAGATGPAGPQGSPGVTGSTGQAGVTGPGVSGAGRLLTNFYFNATGATGPAGLSFPITGNSAFLANLQVVGGTGGTRVGMGIPSGAQLYASVIGVSTGFNPQTAHLTSSALTSSLAPFHQGASAYMQVEGMVIAPQGVTGTVQIQMANMAATGLTGAIYTGSFMLVYNSN